MDLRSASVWHAIDWAPGKNVVPKCVGEYAEVVFYGVWRLPADTMTKVKQGLRRFMPRRVATYSSPGFETLIFVHISQKNRGF